MIKKKLGVHIKLIFGIKHSSDKNKIQLRDSLNSFPSFDFFIGTKAIGQKTRTGTEYPFHKINLTPFNLFVSRKMIKMSQKS